jgi:hypothetical protein
MFHASDDLPPTLKASSLTLKLGTVADRWRFGILVFLAPN